MESTVMWIWTVCGLLFGISEVAYKRQRARVLQPAWLRPTWVRALILMAICLLVRPWLHTGEPILTGSWFRVVAPTVLSAAGLYLGSALLGAILAPTLLPPGPPRWGGRPVATIRRRSLKALRAIYLTRARHAASAIHEPADARRLDVPRSFDELLSLPGVRAHLEQGLDQMVTYLLDQDDPSRLLRDASELSLLEDTPLDLVREDDGSQAARVRRDLDLLLDGLVDTSEGRPPFVGHRHVPGGEPFLDAPTGAVRRR